MSLVIRAYLIPKTSSGSTCVKDSSNLSIVAFFHVPFSKILLNYFSFIDHLCIKLLPVQKLFVKKSFSI